VGAYTYSIHEAPGVVAANNFLSLFNPVGNPYVFIVTTTFIVPYAAGGTSSIVGVSTDRITAVSGGTLVDKPTIPKLNTRRPDSTADVRYGNPAVTKTGHTFGHIPPAIATGAGAGALAIITSPGGGLALRPGQGLVLSTASGDTDQVWNLGWAWLERRIG
jgi:hypothetical protein